MAAPNATTLNSIIINQAMVLATILNSEKCCCCCCFGASVGTMTGGGTAGCIVGCNDDGGDVGGVIIVGVGTFDGTLGVDFGASVLCVGVGIGGTTTMGAPVVLVETGACDGAEVVFFGMGLDVGIIVPACGAVTGDSVV